MSTQPSDSAIVARLIQQIPSWPPEGEALRCDYDAQGYLRRLNLSQLQLTYLGPELGQFSQLQELDLSSNLFMSLPAELGQLSHLRLLNVTHNQLLSLPATIGQLSQLRKLLLFHNQLMQIPKELGRLSQLQELDLSLNSLPQVPKELGRLSQLQELDLSHNQLTQIPAEVGQLSQLQSLFLGHNQLTSLPEKLGCLPQLQKLSVIHNPLTHLPITILQLSSLGKLELDHDQELTQNTVEDPIIPSPEPLPILFPPRSLEGKVAAIVWSPNGAYMACAINGYKFGLHPENVVQIWDSLTGVQISTCHIPACSRLLWSPDSTRFIIEWGPPPLSVWDAQTGKSLGSNTEHIEGIHTIVQDIAWSPDGACIACMGIAVDHGSSFGEIFVRGTKNNQISIWNAATGQSIISYQGYSYNKNVPLSNQNHVQPEALAWSPLGSHIASTADGDESIRIWDATTGYDFSSTHIPAFSPIRSGLAWSPDAAFLAAASKKNVYVWELTAAASFLREVCTYTSHGREVLQITWAPTPSPTNARAIASADEGHCIHIWNVTTGQTLATYQGHRQEQNTGKSPSIEMAWSPDGQYVASSLKERYDHAEKPRSIHLWEATSGKLIGVFAGSFWGWTSQGLSITVVSDNMVTTMSQALP